MRMFIAAILCVCVQAAEPLKLTQAEYEDRIAGAWNGQIIGTLMGFQFEGQRASAERVFVDSYPHKIEAAPVDDDYYYELVALRAFEKYGVHMTLDQLGAQWKEDEAGTWGSSEQTRLALLKGVPGSQAGLPRYNKLWWTIGPQFSGDIYGMIAPGDANLAGALARKYSHINGYAEGADGGVFVAGLVSLAFRESDPHEIVRQAAKLIHPSSPYRQCLDMVIAMAEQGAPAAQVFRAIEDRWRLEYPPLNNAVPNGGIVAASVWYGEGDYLKTVNLAYHAADFSDADCNAANAGAVVGAMHGMKALPRHLVEPLNDRIAGPNLGPVKFTKPVDERISGIVRRIAALGRKILGAGGGDLVVPWRDVRTQPAERFELADFAKEWDPAWTLNRAGFGIGGGRCPRGTYIDGDVLATWPRDEARGLVFRRTAQAGAAPRLELEVAADPGCAWQLEVFANNANVLRRTIESGAGAPARQWQAIQVDLAAFAGREVELRVYQRTILPETLDTGNAYWRRMRLQ
ncbi:MAG: ADP-ribosylglycohydrolase family protein [Acidobacteriota bacterium]